MERVTIIAELGSCHDNDIDKAISLIDTAADIGADVAKLQWWSDPDLLADRRNVPDSYREIYRRYTMPKAWLGKLREECTLKRIKLGITTYLPGDVTITAPLADVMKVSSFEAEASDLLDAHVPWVVNQHRPLIISLGMGGHRQPWCQFHGKERYLLCVSSYPAPVEALNLATLWPRTDDDEHGHDFSPDGFSDHSDPFLTWTGALAVAAGAKIVEAHLRLVDTDPRNPDASHAMAPDQFRDYVRHIRFTERCVGTVAETHTTLPCEQPMAAYRVRTS